jgi:putative flippase GtrA
MLPRIVRFGMVGAASTLAYIALALLGEGLGLAVAVASIAAYSLCIPFAYLGHRHLTFGSDRPHREALSRFVALSLLGLGISAAAPWLLCDLLRLPAFVGVFTVAILVPLASFAGQSLFVFPSAKEVQGAIPRPG